LKLAAKESISELTKHLNVRYHFIRNCVQKSKIELVHVESENNNADILTKPITNVQRFNKLKLMMGMISLKDLNRLNQIMDEQEISYLNTNKIKNRTITERITPWKSVTIPIHEYLHREQSYLREAYGKINEIDDMKLDYHEVYNTVLLI
jgi:hypothetical protein